MSTAAEGSGAVPSWTLTDRLIKSRAHAGMNQRDIAEALDISVRTVNRYEAGDTVKRGIVIGWAFACGVSPEWLLTGQSVTGGDEGGVTRRYPANNNPTMLTTPWTMAA